LLEAMASGLPVVATRAGAIPEVVADGETGVLVAPGRPNELAAAFRNLGDSSLRAQFGAAGRARVTREFTLEKMCRETDALYRRCIRRRFIKMEAQIACAVSTVN
jgi:glycosyltransferase involved in cell wall biosynthesis